MQEEEAFEIVYHDIKTLKEQIAQNRKLTELALQLIAEVKEQLQQLQMR